MKKFTILGSETKIEIEVLDRFHPASVGTWEGDWVGAAITVAIPGYAAHFPANLRTNEFQEFRDQLAAMNKDLEGTASFLSIEDAIEVKAVMDTLGGIYWEVSTCYPVRGAVLTFDFGSDQSYLDQLIKELDEVLTEFPVLESQNDFKSNFKKISGKIFGSRRN